MPRLTHKVLGVTVDVSDETAAGMQGAWESADKPQAKSAPKPSPTKK